jgi:hypothetical protein
MKGYLRGLAWVLLVGGGVLAVVMTVRAVTNQHFFDARDALERHPDHILFQAQYYDALAYHIAYVLTAVVSSLLGVIGSAVLFGLSAILQKLDDRPPTRALS